MDTVGVMAALAEWARDQAAAYGRLAAALEAAAGDRTGSGPGVAGQPVAAAAVASAPPVVAVPLGTRMDAIWRLPGLAAEGGMRPSQIARAINQPQQGIYDALERLARKGLLERVPGSTAWRRVNR